MLGIDFVNYMQSWKVGSYVSAEDFADRFNWLLSTVLLILSALVISAKQYVMQPLSCFCSKSGASKTIEYVENYCWTSGTYAFAETDSLPRTKAEWETVEHRKINYYQWVPFILGLQCILFYLPHLFWLAMVTNRLGSDAQYLVTEAAGVSRQAGPGKREELVDHLARSVLHMQTAHREYREGRLADFRARLVGAVGICVPSKRLGTALVFAYFISKLLYLANCIGQLFIMFRFLGLDRRRDGSFAAKLIGWDLLTSSGRDWSSGLFPRSSLCRVRLFSVGMEVLVCQCALPVNMLNEKVYMLLWLWTLAAAAATLVSLPVWLARVAFSASRHRFVHRQLFLARAIDKCFEAGNCEATRFADNLLHADGVFLFKMMQLNAGDVVTGQVLRRLLELWRERADWEAAGREGQGGSCEKAKENCYGSDC